MNAPKAVLQLLIVAIIFLLFAAIFLPVIIRSLAHPAGRWLYGIFAVICVVLALRLRHALSELE